ncbi:hypothetical protein [Pseudaminobacter soli (ex Li et al. 2025)]|uniref:hypothetical protein n=1 Tax=Pseudaminobacter soli (ex Li et al. 2025) TaxID=1295366 RepID=UPI002476A245|nr:hypothetical protein [Mesorhizobium soli]
MTKQPWRKDVPTSHQFLSSADLEKIKRVLTDAHLSGSVNEAARFLMYKYLEGVTEEAAMAEALARYIKLRSGWRLSLGGDLGKKERRAPER